MVRAAMAGLATLLAAPAAAEALPDAGRIEAHVRFLADDLLEGRGLGTRGHEIAARYVAQQFAMLGLEPAGTDGWLQRIAFEERRFASERETLTLTGVGNPGGPAKRLVNGVELTVRPGDKAGAETVKGGLVFAGYGLQAPSESLDDYRGLDAKGRIVVVLSGFPPGLNSEIGAHLARSKASFAAKAGAIGLIQVRTTAAAALSPWAKSASRARLPSRGWLTPDGKPGSDAPGLRFNAGIDDASAALLFAGAAQDFAAVRAAAATGPVAGFALAGSATLERATAVTPLSSPNVVGLLPGRGALGDQIVLVTAHLDHLGVRPELPGDKIHNGAMDNAGGIATLLETARLMAADKRSAGRRSVLFVALTAEESGLLGAEYFARFPVRPLSRIVANVNLDMPILTCDFADVIAYGSSRSTLGPLIDKAARGMGLAASPDPQPVEAIFTRSDHYMLVRAGVPAVFLKTGWRDTKGGLGCRAADVNFRRDHYHEPSDDLSLPFDWRAAAKFAGLNARITARLASDRLAPRWYAGDFFGETFAPAAPKAPAPAER